MKLSIPFAGSLSIVVFGVLAITITMPSCTDESIVLATLSAGPDGGGPSPEAGDAALVPPSNSCTDNASCPAGTFCSKTSCTAATGSCAPIPDAGQCNQPMAVECGCEDGVSYYNDCLRRAHAVSFGVSGVCGSDNQMVCSPDGVFKCTDPTTQKCFVQLGGGFTGGGGGGKPPDCPSAAYPGTCWVIPSVCPSAADGDRYDLCGAGQRGCVDTCEAVASGVASRHDSFCGSNPHGN